MQVKTFYDSVTNTFSHVVVDNDNQKCAVIDSVLDYDQYSAEINTHNADKIINFIEEKNLSNQWILETHIHADHVSAADYLKKRIGGLTAIGSGIKKVLKHWVPIFDTKGEIPINGGQFDQLFSNGDRFNIGDLEVEVISTPGHTPACSSYLVNNSIFVGDTLFAPNRGTARVDFPDGNAKELYESIQKLYSLPDTTKVYLCHDYPDSGKKPVSYTTIGQQKAENIMLNQFTTLTEFIEKREARDKTLSVPKLIFPAIQTNMRLGSFGKASKNGIQYIKIPVDVIKGC